jgi:ribonuclease-3
VTLFRRRPAWVREVESRIGYRFHDPALLETALTHRSHVHEAPEGTGTNYERLEYLGDATLGFVVSEWLYTADPAATEGVLTRRRQLVVRTSTLARAAGRLGLDAAMRLGRGEERTGGREKPSLMADTFEAVLGAVYLDGGIRRCRAFVTRHLGDVLQQAGDPGQTSDDYKTRLQEVTQARLRRTPRYRIVSMTGPAHALRFEVEVQVGPNVLGTGTGSNRKRAEQAAARGALARLEDLDRTERHET